ncbi:hypothetical protein [uncultured Brevundimonas sp.]|uniref:hypothetical protein n=1 Tax=uncultured Brevundimonas sp. TaxID=213418 RepID=UPI0025D89597|nr:hypothetical protein [uncultured Brevundimonas sp.]
MGIPIEIVGEGTDWSAIAAWVQAAGSILAIWFAGRFVVRQQLLSRVERIEAAVGVISLASALAQEIKAALHVHDMGNVSWDGGRERFDRVGRYLEQIPLLDLGSIALIEVVDQAQRRFADLTTDFFEAVTPDPITFIDLSKPIIDDHEQALIEIERKACVLLSRAQKRARRWWMPS